MLRSQSLYYTDTETNNGVALLEQCIIDIFEESGELPIIICGDLNAKRDVQLLDDAAEDVFDEDITDGTDYGRVSKDVALNEFGPHLLYVCVRNSILLYSIVYCQEMKTGISHIFLTVVQALLTILLCQDA